MSAATPAPVTYTDYSEALACVYRWLDEGVRPVYVVPDCTERLGRAWRVTTVAPRDWTDVTIISGAGKGAA